MFSPQKKLTISNDQAKFKDTTYLQGVLSIPEERGPSNCTSKYALKFMRVRMLLVHVLPALLYALLLSLLEKERVLVCKARLCHKVHQMEVPRGR